MAETSQHIQTRAVHAGERRPGPEGSVVYPIFQGTVYTAERDAAYHDIQYLRLNSTPSQLYLHDKLAALEGTGAALATASGMAAITTTLHSLLRAGDHVLVADVLYGGTHDFFTQHAEANGWTFSMVDPHDPSQWHGALTADTKVFYVESMSNPMVRVPLLADIAAFAQTHGLKSVIDNTFCTPVNFRPFSLGFDIVVHSATKALNGHSDLVAGAVMGGEEDVTAVRHTLNHYGASLDPHAGFLLARGLKTLALRVRALNANASALAETLVQHPKVVEVNYPGLASHPDHAVASELFDGFGGMLSLRVAGGGGAAAALCEAVRIPYSAPSLGGVESLITRPAISSHAGMSSQARAAIGITDELVRVSCGIEDPADLVADFSQALERV